MTKPITNNSVPHDPLDVLIFAEDYLVETLLGGYYLTQESSDIEIRTPDEMRSRRKAEIKEWGDSLVENRRASKVRYLENNDQSYVDRFRVELFWPDKNIRETADYIAETVSFSPLLVNPSTNGLKGLTYLYALDPNAWFLGIVLIGRKYIALDHYKMREIIRDDGEHSKGGFLYRIPVENNKSFVYIKVTRITKSGKTMNREI